MASSDDLTNLATPPSCTADFCLIPLGTPTASVSKEVAEVQRLLKKSGLNFSMHSAGTTVGEFSGAAELLSLGCPAHPSNEEQRDLGTQ
jgi:hypothetical protein